MEPQTVPAAALIGARERVEALHKSIVADGVTLLGENFHSFGLMPEPAPDAQVALGMALSATTENQKLLSKAVAQVKDRAEKAEQLAKAEKEGGDAAFSLVRKLSKALVDSGAYAVCECKGAPAADGKPCAKCPDLPGLTRKGGKR